MTHTAPLGSGGVPNTGMRDAITNNLHAADAYHTPHDVVTSRSAAGQRFHNIMPSTPEQRVLGQREARSVLRGQLKAIRTAQTPEQLHAIPNSPFHPGTADAYHNGTATRMP